jgi:hypothetical protein
MNKYDKHILVLPEDDANRQITDGFLIEIGGTGQLKVLRPAGGWRHVLDQFKSVYVAVMDRYPKCTMILLIDFDKSADRREQAKAVVPTQFSDRVFILGVWSEPEKLPDGLEATGRALAEDCRNGTSTTWDHELLKHNAAEVERLRQFVRPILF